MLTVKDAALSLVLRTQSLSLGHQVLLDPLVRRVAMVRGALVVLKENLDQAAIPVLWALLERMDRMGVLEPPAFREHRAQLVRLDMRVVTGNKAPLAQADPQAPLVLKGQLAHKARPGKTARPRPMI